MNRIILDELGRRWWIWGLVGLACVVFASCADAHQNNIFYGTFYPAIFGMPLLGLQFRCGRVLLTLPFTARQIGRTVWIQSVVIPSLVLALFTGLGVFLNYHLTFLTDIKSDFTDSTTVRSGFLAAWFQLAVVGSLGFGSGFWLFSLISPSSEQRRTLRAQLHGFVLLIAIIGGGYLLARSHISGEIKFVIICLLGVFLTALGWFRAENMFIKNVTYRNGISNVGKPKEAFKPRAGYGGIPFLIINCCIRYIVFMAFIAVAVAGILLFVLVFHPDPADPPMKRSDFLVPLKILLFYCLFLSFWMVLPVSMHQKFLRSLPMTSKKLTAVILGLPIVPFFVLLGIIVPFVIQIFGVPAVVSLLKEGILLLPPICVLATAMVWNSERRFARIFIAVIVFIISAIPAIYYLIWAPTLHIWMMPLWMNITIPLVSCVLAFYIINRLLTRNVMTYREQMHIFVFPETPMW